MSKVLRDNKVLLQKIKKNTLLSDRCAMMSSSVGFAFSLKVDDYVVLPNSCQLEKCDIFTGRNCHSATISNYIKKGLKLPKTIDIDKQFKFRERSGYFITMNNW